MRGPLTRRRERRILEALQTVGPLSDEQLASFLRTPYTCLQRPLLNLAQNKQISVTKRIGLDGYYFIWSITRQDNADE